MPLYTLTTRAGVLTDGVKAKLAGELTTLQLTFRVFRETGCMSSFRTMRPEMASPQENRRQPLR